MKTDKKAIILVVDSEPIIIGAVKAALESTGHVVVGARTTAEALKALVEPFDVVFLHRATLDAEAEEIVRAARYLGPITLILTSSERSEEAERNKLRLGADEIVYKPLSPLDLRAAVGRHIRAQGEGEVPGSPHILIVDDDEIVLESVKDILKGHYEVTAVSSPHEALRKLKETPFEILLTDLMMEEMTGMDLIRAANNIRPTLLAIVITGYGSKDLAVEAMKEGAYDFLEKPLTPELIRQSVTRTWTALRTKLENRKLLGELKRANKEIRAQLVHSGKMATLGRFAAGVAHEIRNPLTSVTMNVAFLLEQFAGDEKALKKLKRIEAEVERASHIVKSLLSFSRVDKAGRRPVRLGDLIDETLELRESEIAHAGVEIQREYDPHAPEVKVTHGEITQVFLNLINNAVDAMPKGGRLVLRVFPERVTRGGRREGDRFKTGSLVVRALFSDNGEGMSEETMKNLFHPFFTTKEPGKGTGLGLFICNGIIERHGGMIEVSSDIGKGTTFTVSLPTEEGNG